MKRRELSATLVELIESVQSDPQDGLIVSDVELVMPMEAGSVVQNGRLIFYADAPHTRWKTGVLPPVHKCQIRVSLVASDDATDEDAL